MLGRLIARLEEDILCLLLVAMTLLVFVEVVLRFGFNTGFIWMQELTLLISTWLVLFGASYGVKVGSHIGVDAFVKMLPANGRRILTLVAVALCLFYCGLFSYGAWVYLKKMHLIGLEMADLPLPKWLAASVLLIGFVLLAIRFLQVGWQVITGQTDSFSLADEAKESMHLAKEVADQEKRS
ncbi:TRAP transporter small permease [Balneatrix alpica]|uniref:TRAP transporter small permease protein n=1 Tax=Balneatrix alpica TaxID=75684 RepID=A0ABV5ZFS7_9GAMM|nr:TRAP transporter small permease [Balneatrix alpica]